MSKSNDLRKLANEIESEHCMDFPVKWIAERIREIADGAAK